jgi:hypothetical protein
VKSEWGASALEYTILVSLVVLMVVGAMTALGRQIDHTLPEGMPSPSTTVVVTSTTCPSPTSTTTPTSTTSTTAPPNAC